MTGGTGDLRREAGQRTRDSLVSAALALLAQRGPEGVTLHEITDAAGANVAAASYHFGSLRRCDAAIEHALDQYLDAQIVVLRPLDTASTLDKLAAAFSGPMVRALAAGGQDLAVIRTVARAGIDPPRAGTRLDAKFDRHARLALRVLKANLPGVSRQELTFRTRCAAGMLNWLVDRSDRGRTAATSAATIERLLVPVVAGVSAPTSAADPFIADPNISSICLTGPAW